MKISKKYLNAKVVSSSCRRCGELMEGYTPTGSPTKEITEKLMTAGGACINKDCRLNVREFLNL